MLAVMYSVSVSVLSCGSVLLVALWCWFQWTHRALLREARKVPVSSRYLPVVGHVLDTVWGIEEATRLAVETSVEAMKKGIYTICFWCGPYPLIMVHGVEDIQKVLNSSATSEKASEYDYSKTSMGEGLLTATVASDGSAYLWQGMFQGSEEKSYKYHQGAHVAHIYLMWLIGVNIWKITRRNINPLFHPRNLEQLMPVFNRNSRELVANLSEHVGQPPVNVLDHAMDTALKTICHLIFGPEIEVDIKSKEFNGLKHVVEMIPEIVMRRIIMLWLRIESVFTFLYRKEMKQIDDCWRTFTDSRLKMTLANNEHKKAVSRGEDSLDNNGNEGDGSEIAGPYYKIILSYLPLILEDPTGSHRIRATMNLVEVYTKLKTVYPEIITDDNLKAEMVTFYASGTDTVGITVASALLILAKYPDIQERLFQEISDVLRADDDVTVYDLDKLQYLDQVYKEVLRWTLILPYIARKATEDIKLSSCTIPAGNTVVVCLLGLHLDPKVYPDPEKFDPERFSPENSHGRHRYSFLPFSGGPRGCIGKRYAELFVKVALIQAVRKYRFTTEMDIHNMKRKLAVVLVSTEGYNVSLQPRC